jgi:hypothetical protein
MMTNTETLTVGKLRDMLAAYDDDMPVLFGTASNDYLHSVIAKPVNDAEELLVDWSDYHDCYTVTEQDDDEDCEWALVLGA